MRAVVAALVAFCAANVPSGGAFAQSASAGVPLQISVAPLVVRFSVAPGGAASTPVTITNSGTQPALVVLSPIDWHTTINGDVRTRPARAATASSLAAMLAISAHELSLAPGETRKIALSLAMPVGTPVTHDRFGGFLIRATPATMSGTAGIGVGTNVLAYESDAAARRHLRLDDLVLRQTERRSISLDARFVNDGETYVRPQIRVRLSRSGRIVRALDDSTSAIFVGQGRRYKRTFDDLEAGHYQLDVSSDYGGTAIVEGTTEFDVR